MIESELPASIQYLLIGVQILATVGFLYMIWPYVRKERWREKFIENKSARSILIVFVIIFLFSYGMAAFFDAFFPVERLDVAP
ncbi:hypothetical protein MNBD_GAMMA04-1931 [hydrothermal vent metagenome]|uniref:Uncharacterized protein n=1 Tax=hydrothermal vent metagenome TaxID=652676 RepID=A0A3B0VM23_9ZZZZ